MLEANHWYACKGEINRYLKIQKEILSEVSPVFSRVRASFFCTIIEELEYSLSLMVNVPPDTGATTTTILNYVEKVLKPNKIDYLRPVIVFMDVRSLINRHYSMQWSQEREIRQSRICRSVQSLGFELLFPDWDEVIEQEFVRLSDNPQEQYKLLYAQELYICDEVFEQFIGAADALVEALIESDV